MVGCITVKLEILGHFSHLSIDVVDELLDSHHLLLATALRTYGNGAVLLFLLTDNHHVRNTLQLVVANLSTELLVAQVDGRTNATKVELLGNYGFGDVEETGILIAVDEILEQKRVRHIDSFIKEHPDALKITSGANNVIYKEK